MDPVRAVATVAAACFGASVGSFLNVVIFRLPRGRSVIAPRSHCFCCGTELSGRDLFPVLSYLLNRGQCRHCGVVYSSQYAWVEALTALYFAALVARWGVGTVSLTFAVAGSAMIAAFVTDVRHKIIPLSLPLVVGAAGLLGALAGRFAPGWLGDGPPHYPPSPAYALAGAALGYGLLEAVVRIGRVAFGKEAMGGGDVLLAAAVGMLLGPGRRFWTFFLIAVFSGGLFGLGLMLTRRAGRHDEIPFGPYLVLGALAMMLWPELAEPVARHFLAPSWGG